MIYERGIIEIKQQSRLYKIVMSSAPAIDINLQFFVAAQKPSTASYRFPKKWDLQNTTNIGYSHTFFIDPKTKKVVYIAMTNGS